MHRSSSGSRVSDGLVVTSSSSSTSQSSSFGANPDNTEEHLPTFNPLSQAAKRERSRIRSAENAIHFIPLVLVLCAIILWFFSNLDERWLGEALSLGIFQFVIAVFKHLYQILNDNIVLIWVFLGSSL